MPVISIQAATWFGALAPQQSSLSRDPSWNARMPIGHITTDLPSFDDLAKDI